MPDRKNGPIFFQDTIANQPTQEIALFEGEASLPGAIGSMIVEDDCIARQEVADPAPIALDEVPSLSYDSTNEMICCKAKTVALDGAELYDRLCAGFEKPRVP